MKIPDTKYDIGDTLWRISANVLCEYKITSIGVYIDSDGTHSIRYSLKNLTKGGDTTVFESEIAEGVFYETKNALRQAMFGDCID